MNDEERAAHLESHLGGLEDWNPEHRVALIEAEFAAVRAEEREACAKLVDNPSTKLIAAAIRARGNQ